MSSVEDDEVAEISPYLAGRKSTRRLLNRVKAIEVRRRVLASEDDTLAREHGQLTALIAGITAQRAERAARKSPLPPRSVESETGGRAPRSVGVPARPTVAPPLMLDRRARLWGRVDDDAAPGLRPIPRYDDPLLDRVGDLFRIPGLPNFFLAQVELHCEFDGLDEVMSTRDPAFDGLALCARLVDAEIDASVAEDLMLGRTDSASNLRRLAGVIEPASQG